VEPIDFNSGNYYSVAANAAMQTVIRPLNFNQRLFVMVNRAVENADTQAAKLALDSFLKTFRSLNPTDRALAEKSIEKLMIRFPVPSESPFVKQNLRTEKELFLDKLVSNGYAVFARQRLSILANETRSQTERNFYLAELLKNSVERINLIEKKVFKAANQYDSQTIKLFRDEHSAIIINTAKYLISHLSVDNKNFVMPNNSIDAFTESIIKLTRETKGFLELIPYNNPQQILLKVNLNKEYETMLNRVLEEPQLSLKQLLPLYSPDLTMKFLNKFNPGELINEQPSLGKEKINFIHDEIKALNGLATTVSSISPSQDEKDSAKELQNLLAAKLIELMPNLENSKDAYLDLLKTLKDKAPSFREAMQDSEAAKTFSEIQLFMRHDDSLRRFFNSFKAENNNSKDARLPEMSSKSPNPILRQHEYRNFLERLGAYADRSLGEEILSEYLNLLKRSPSFTSLKENLKSLNAFINDNFAKDDFKDGSPLHKSLVKILEPILNTYDEDSLKNLYQADKRELSKQLKNLNLEQRFEEFIIALS